MIRLILIDVDGTLIGRDGVHPTTWPAVARALGRCVDVGLCTGRIGQGSALAYAKQVSPEGFHIFQSGAVVSRPDEPAVHATALAPEGVRALIEASRREGEPIELYTERGFYLEWENDLTRVHAEHLQLPPTIQDLTTIGEPIVRAQWVVDEADWPRFREITRAIGGIDVNPATAPWSPRTVFSNLTRVGTSKAAALRWLAGHLGITAAQVAMIGDATNDLDALEAAGLGIAMGNAPQLVKDRSQVVVGPVDEGGLAQAIDLAIDHG